MKNREGSGRSPDGPPPVLSPFPPHATARRIAQTCRRGKGAPQHSRARARQAAKRAPVVPCPDKTARNTGQRATRGIFLQDGRHSKRAENHPETGPETGRIRKHLQEIKEEINRPRPQGTGLSVTTQESRRASFNPSGKNACVHGPFETAIALIEGPRVTALRGKNVLKWIGA